MSRDFIETAKPSGPAGGDLSGVYPDPSVLDDSHLHTNITIPWPGYIVDFTHNSAPSLILKALQSDDQIREILIQITEAFDAGFKISLGFPADTDEVVKVDEAYLQRVGDYGFDVYRISTVAETFTAFFTGTSTQGKGKIFVEER